MRGFAFAEVAFPCACPLLFGVTVPAFFLRLGPVFAAAFLPLLVTHRGPLAQRFDVIAREVEFKGCASGISLGILSFESLDHEPCRMTDLVNRTGEVGVLESAQQDFAGFGDLEGGFGVLLEGL